MARSLEQQFTEGLKTTSSSFEMLGKHLDVSPPKQSTIFARSIPRLQISSLITEGEGERDAFIRINSKEAPFPVSRGGATPRNLASARIATGASASALQTPASSRYSSSSFSGMLKFRSPPRKDLAWSSELGLAHRTGWVQDGNAHRWCPKGVNEGVSDLIGLYRGVSSALIKDDAMNAQLHSSGALTVSPSR